MNTQPEPMGTPSSQPWLLRLGEVLENTRLCKSQLYRLMDAGEFPKPVRLGPRTVRWTNKTVRCWVENLPQEE